MDEFLQELDEDVEGMQSTVYYLQQELRKSGETISSLERQLRKYKKGKGKGKRTRVVTNEEGEQVEEEVEEDDDDEEEDEQEVENEDETEPKEEWKEVGEGEGWGEWKEGEEGEDWNQWEEEEEDATEVELHDYAEEETAGDWVEDGKESDCVKSNRATNDKDSSPKDNSVSLKRTKGSEELDEKFETPVRKKLKPLLPPSDISKEFSIVEGIEETTKANNDDA